MTKDLKAGVTVLPELPKKCHYSYGCEEPAFMYEKLSGNKARGACRHHILEGGYLEDKLGLFTADELLKDKYPEYANTLKDIIFGKEVKRE